MVKNGSRTLIVALGSRRCYTCEAQPAWTVGGTAGWSSMVGQTNSTFSPPLEGTSIAGALFLDRAMWQRLSIGGEVSLMGDVKSPQTLHTADVFSQYRSRHHDTLALAIFKARVMRSEQLNIAVVAGAGPAWRHTVREGTARGNQGVWNVREDVSSIVFAEAVGADFSLSFPFQNRARLFGPIRVLERPRPRRSEGHTVRRASNRRRYSVGVLNGPEPASIPLQSNRLSQEPSAARAAREAGHHHERQLGTEQLATGVASKKRPSREARQGNISATMIAASNHHWRNQRCALSASRLLRFIV